MQNFRNLRVWQKAHALSISISALCDSFARRKPSLARQLERSVEAIAAHIAEGCGRATDRDFSHYCSMGISTANESENHLLKAFAYNVISEKEFTPHLERIIEVRKMLIGLKKRLDGGPAGDPDAKLD